MTPQQLKASILKYAMQGKLVEQKPEDGTGEDLFCKMQQVSKPNKNVTPIVEEEIPFDIPSSWKWCKFGELVDCSMGKTPPRAEPVWWQNDIHWVSISDMKDYGHISYTKEMVSQKALEEKFGGISTKGTLLMSFKLTVGRTSILDIDAVHNEAIISIYPYVDTENYFRDYLFYILPIVTQWGDSKNAIKGKTLNSKSIANLMIPLAPLNELQRIVAKIEELLPLVDRYAASYEKLEQFNAKFPEDMKKSILQYAIQGKLVDQRSEEGTGEELYRQIQEEKKRLIKEGTIKKEKPLAEIAEDEIPFDIPESWKWVRLSQIAILENGDRSGKYPVEKDYVDFGVPFFGAKDMCDAVMSFDNVRYISMEKFAELGNGKLQDKDFICLLRGSVGKCALFVADEQHHTGFICAQMVIIRCINTALCHYIASFLASPFYLRYIDSKVTGTAVRQLPAKELGNVLIPLPPLAEQNRIVAKLEGILPLCERLK
jgi:type I restriction enzyme S subunit